MRTEQLNEVHARLAQHEGSSIAMIAQQAEDISKLQERLKEARLKLNEAMLNRARVEAQLAEAQAAMSSL